MTCLASKATRLAKDPQRHGVVLIQLVKERGFLQYLFVMGALSSHEDLLPIIFSFAFVCVEIEATSKKIPLDLANCRIWGVY